MTAWMRSVVSAEGPRRRKSITALTIEKVFSEENVSVDIQKMKHAKQITGSQYLMKSRLELICPSTDCKLQCNPSPLRKRGTPTFRCAPPIISEEGLPLKA